MEYNYEVLDEYINTVEPQPNYKSLIKRIFKYMLVNSANQLNYDSPEWAVIGSDTDIIQIIQQRGYSFAGLCDVAIKYHHNELVGWIQENYDDNDSIFGRDINTASLIHQINESPHNY